MKKTNSKFIITIFAVIVAALAIYIYTLLTVNDEGSASNSRNTSGPSFSAASSEQVEWITEGLKEGYTLTNLRTVKSKDFDNVYFVGGIVTRERSGNKSVAIWATGGKADISMCYSVDEFSLTCSNYPDGSNTAAKISMSDDGAFELFDYLSETLD